jgi:AcrR family transcriptional regulator
MVWRMQRAGSAKAKRVVSRARPARQARAKPKPRANRRERSAERREAILAAALDEFSQAGFAAARLDDVAKRAGVAKGTIYLYFRDKESLFQELVRSMLAPVIGAIEALGSADISANLLGSQIVDLFMREIYETRRKEVIRLIMTEGRRFPQLAEFYYREVLSRALASMRELLRRSAARGEVPAALVDFPQLVAAPALIAVMWGGLFDRFEPLDVRSMMQAHVELLFRARRET